MTISRTREDDPRYQRSLRALLDAVTGLVDAAPLQEISITRIVETAGVTRPTFYQHFSDVADAARRAGLERLGAAFPLSLPDLPDAEALRQHIEHDTAPVLAHLLEHRTFYLRVLEGGGNVAFFQDIAEFVAARMLPEFIDQASGGVEQQARDRLAVMAGGVTWLVIAWLRDDTVNHDAVAMARRIAAVVIASSGPAG